MRRRTAVLVTVTAVSGVMAMFPPASVTPARAEVHGTCAGVIGNATVHSPLFYPGLGFSPHSASFTFHFDQALSVCMPTWLPTISALGFLHGHCGFSTGTMVTSVGDSFGFVMTGGRVVFTGGMSGSMSRTENLPAGSSCFTGATSFIVGHGVTVRQSCTVGLSVPPRPFRTTPASEGDTGGTGQAVALSSSPGKVRHDRTGTT